MTIAMVLSGGGARGAFEAGVIEAFEEAGIVPEILTGTSAGAINATAMAIGMPARQLSEMWLGLRSKDVYRVRVDLPRALRPLRLVSSTLTNLLDPPSLAIKLLEAIGWTWLLDTQPLHELLRETLGSEEVTIQPGRTLTVVAVEAVTGRLVRFTNTPPADRTDTRYSQVAMTVDHVLASAAIPVLFKPVNIEGGVYWDGGLGANTPLGAALGHRPDVCFVVATGAVDRTAAAPRSLSESISLLVDDLLRSSLVKDMEHAERINELVRLSDGTSRYKEVELHLIAPPPGGAGVHEFLDFEESATSLLIAQGREAGKAAIEAYERGRDQPDRGRGHFTR